MVRTPKSPVTRVTYINGQVPAITINGKTFPVMHHMENESVTPSAQDNIRNSGVPLM
jgi:hypothetical protein